MYLKSSKTEEGYSDVSVRVLSNANGITAKFETGCPTGNADGIGRGLASNVKVKPGRIG